jgi:hypothetical protein
MRASAGVLVLGVGVGRRHHRVKAELVVGGGLTVVSGRNRTGRWRPGTRGPRRRMPDRRLWVRTARVA